LIAAAALPTSLPAASAAVSTARSSAPFDLDGTWSVTVKDCSEPGFVFRGVKVSITRWSKGSGSFEEYITSPNPDGTNYGSKFGSEDSGGEVRLYLFAKQKGFTLYGAYYLLTRRTGKVLTMTETSGCATITLTRIATARAKQAPRSVA
jgi:hypothetical protein